MWVRQVLDGLVGWAQAQGGVEQPSSNVTWQQQQHYLTPPLLLACLQVQLDLGNRGIMETIFRTYAWEKQLRPLR